MNYSIEARVVICKGDCNAEEWHLIWLPAVVAAAPTTSRPPSLSPNRVNNVTPPYT